MSNLIITVGRQFGSGGREIANKIAKHFNIKCYDNELVDLAAEHSGLHKDFVASCDEKAVSSFAFSVSNNFYIPANGAHQVQIKAYFAQFEVLKKLAESESFVVVGRVADYILRNKENKISIFISANTNDRINRIMEFENISESKAEKMILKADKNRAKYYNFFSQSKWGDAKTYDICINSSLMGIDKTADVLIKYIEEYIASKKEK